MKGPLIYDLAVITQTERCAFSDCNRMYAVNYEFGFEYLFVKDTKQWEDARVDCVARGYNLAKLESEQEHDYFTGLWRTSNCK